MLRLDRRTVHVALAAAGVCLFCCALLWPVLLQGKVLYWGDISLYFASMEDLVARALRQGRLPLWNPYVLCGQPLAANPQCWLFYPGTAMLPGRSPEVYLTISALAHVVICAVGAMLYLRRLSGTALGAFLGACVFATGGFAISKLQFPTMTQAIAWTPWLLLAVRRAIDHPNAMGAAAVGLALGLLLLAGHAQVAYLSLLAAGAYAALRVLSVRRHGGSARSCLRVLAGGFVLGCLLAGAQMAPTLEMAAGSSREHMSLRQADRFVMHPSQFVNFFAPRHFGDPAAGDYWGPGNMWETCVYVGIVPLGLAVFGAWSGRRRRAVRFYAALTIISMILAIGQWGGLYAIAFHVLPGLSLFHDPARFTFLVTLGLAVLTAVGVRRVRETGVPRWLRAVVVAVALVDLWAFSSTLNPLIARNLAARMALRPQALTSPPAGRLYSVNRESVWRRLVNYEGYGPPNGHYIDALRGSATPNLASRWGIEEAGGYEPVPLHTATEIDGATRKAFARTSPTLGKLLALMDVGAVAVPLGDRANVSDGRTKRLPGVTLAAPPQHGARARLVPTALVRDPHWAAGAVGLPDVDIATTAVVSESVDLPRPAPGAGLGEPAEARVRLLCADQMEVLMGRRTWPGLLVVSVALAPGWTARVDGRPARIVRADHAFIGVRVPSDAFEVSLRYRPPSLEVGIYLTCTGVTVLCALLSLSLFGGLASGRSLGAGILSAPDTRGGSGERHA
ncbi:MAG: YfhO family protein [Armatimonadetes bacterium]|nr:YfhO family protein [Armatimonadota bacterium]